MSVVGGGELSSYMEAIPDRPWVGVRVQIVLLGWGLAPPEYIAMPPYHTYMIFVKTFTLADFGHVIMLYFTQKHEIRLNLETVASSTLVFK